MMRRIKLGLVAVGLVVASGMAGAQSGGGCLQGTWHYFDQSGRLVGEQTVGCGADDGAWGSRTSTSTFSQGCLSAM
jgi:hypothetical protein